MTKKINILFLGFLIFTICPSCWDYTEYNDLARITCTAVDYDKDTNRTTVTVQYDSLGNSPSNQGSSGGGTGATMCSATGATFYAAVSKLQQAIMNKLFYGYLNTLIIGEEAAKYKMLDIMELHNRTPVIRNSANIIITKGKAIDILSIVNPSNPEPIATQIIKQLKTSAASDGAYPVTIQDFIAMLSISGIEPTAPRIIGTKTPSKRTAFGGTANNTELAIEKQGDFVVSGTAVFKKDKLVGWMNEKESMGFGWITGKNIKSYQTSLAKESDSSSDVLYFRINESKSKTKVRLVNNEPVVSITIHITADLRKYYSGKGEEFIYGSELAHLQDLLSESVKSDAEAALAKAQRNLQSDVFGFGFEFFRKYPMLWKNKYEAQWDNLYPSLSVNIKVNSKIINTGTNIKKLIIN